MNNFKPKVMVGDLRKPQCEFTSDLNFLAHQTRLMQRKMAEERTVESDSLQQLRLKTRVKRKIDALIQ